MAAALVSSCRRTVEIRCFCSEEYRGTFDVTVIDGVTTEITDDGDPVGEYSLDDFFTVEDLFGHIRLAYSDQITVV